MPGFRLRMKKMTSSIRAVLSVLQFVNEIGPPSHLNWTFQIGLFIAEPHHAENRHGDAEPVEEAEEVDNGEYVVGEGVQESHDAL